MDIKCRISSDAHVIHNLMIRAFNEYKNEIPPSSALEETVQSVSDTLDKGDKALVAYKENDPVGMIRFGMENESLYFYGLSVLPERQGEGIGKKLLKSLEEYADENSVSDIFCKVRMKVPKNIKLYKSVGYTIQDEEIVHKPNGISLKVVVMKKSLRE